MFKRRIIIENVNKGFYSHNHFLVYQTGEFLIKKNLELKTSLVEVHVNDNFQKISFVNGFYVGISGVGYSILDIDLKLQKKTIVENGIGDYKLYNNNSVIITTNYDYSLFLSKQGIQNIWDDKVIWETDFGGILSSIDGQIFFTLSLNSIERRNFNDGKILWSCSFDGDTKGKYPQLIGTTDNLIFLGIDVLDKLLAIDINDGSIKWELETIPKFEMLDSTKGKIHSLTAAYFCVDAKNGKQIDSFLERSYFEEIGLISQRGNYAIVGDHLITTDHSKGIIGAFNTLTHKFDWVHKEEGISFPGANPIIYSEPYLFVHDNKGTLHIFEKE